MYLSTITRPASGGARQRLAAVSANVVALGAASLIRCWQRGDGVNDIWSVPADGSGSPAKSVSEAGSPAV